MNSLGRFVLISGIYKFPIKANLPLFFMLFTKTLEPKLLDFQQIQLTLPKKITVEELLDNYPVQVKYPVHWGDMDAARHVNNLIYMRWGESARLQYFEQMGMDVSFNLGSIGPILGWQDCKYIFPMTYPDTAIIGVRASEIKPDRFFLECRVVSEQHQKIAAIMQQSIIAYDYTNLKKAPLPDAWLSAISKMEK